LKTDENSFRKSALRTFAKEYDPIFCWHDDLSKNLRVFMEDAIQCQIFDFSESFAARFKNEADFDSLSWLVFNINPKDSAQKWEGLIDRIETIFKQQLSDPAAIKVKFIASSRDTYGKYPFPNITKTNFDAAWFDAEFAKESVFNEEKQKYENVHDESSTKLSLILNNFLHVLYCFPPLPVHVLQIFEHHMLKNYFSSKKAQHSSSTKESLLEYFYSSFVMKKYLSYYYNILDYFQFTFGKVGPLFLYSDLSAKGSKATGDKKVFKVVDAPSLHLIKDRKWLRFPSNPIYSKVGKPGKEYIKFQTQDVSGADEVVIPALELFIMLKDKIKSNYFSLYSIPKFSKPEIYEIGFANNETDLFEKQNGIFIRKAYYNKDMANFKYYLSRYALALFDAKVLPYMKSWFPKEEGKKEEGK
jgi:hypothetical protein